MPTSIRLSISFGALFFSAVSGLLVVMILFSEPHPWTLDSAATSALLGLPDGTRIDAWLASEHTPKGLVFLLSSLYDCVLLSFLGYCCLVLAIIFLAPNNNALVLFTEVINIVLLYTIGYAQQIVPAEQNTVHLPLYRTTVVISAFGFITHVWKMISSSRTGKKAKGH